MASPHPDIGRVLEVLDEIKTSFRDLQPIYLPHLQNIPLELGMSWEPTWKSTPLLDNFVHSFDLKVDDTVDKEVANTLLGAYTGVPLATGRLAQVIEGGGMRRIFAICNYIKQSLLFPVHKWPMKVLSSIPTDGTFDQERLLLRFKSKRKRQTFSFDLKSATDRWPLSVIFSLMSCIFESTLASSIVNNSLGLSTHFLSYLP
ncbi:hypothetical protein KY285_010714 [Solanum tuberosum]|nr:hypothetical protein KY289_011295 [Solanum tuberosum]KAH0735007.1 hypothetical protein KY285_010714 [Solanum tuberosum]